MSIASGFTKMKNYILTSSGYKLLSRWTSSQTVHMGDGTDDTDTVEYRFGAMKGITSSLATDNDEFALSASAGKNLQDQCTQLNQSLVKHSHTWDSITGKPSAFPPSSSDLLNKIYPVGSIYMSINNVSPQAFIGGIWEQIKNRWLVGAGDEYAVGTYGGNAVHSHTQRMIFTANYAGNNGLMYTAGGTTPTDVIYTGETRSVPPYYAVYMWKRIA